MLTLYKIQRSKDVTVTINTTLQHLPNILVIHDGRKGHLNPSLAIAEMISEQHPFNTISFQLPIQLNKKLVSILKKLSHFPQIFQIIGQIFFKFQPQGIENTKLIVCSGMPNLIYAAYLSRKYHIPLLYSGGTRKFNTALINWIVASVPENNACTQIIVPVGPTLAQFSTIRNTLPLQEASLLLGGATEEYPFNQQHISTIIENFTQFCQQHHLQGNIVTSRRTAPFSENMQQWMTQQQLRLITPMQNIAVCDILQRSQYAFVTSDSDTMLSEALHTGRTVISVGLNYTTASFFDPLIAQHYLQRKTCEDLHTAIELPSPLMRNAIAQPILNALNPILKNSVLQNTAHSLHSIQHFA